MPTLIIQTEIDAPPELCFDLARDIGFHCASAAQPGERAVAGITKGLIELGQSVTFEAVHLGVRQRLTSQVVEFERPARFVDEMTRGAFKSMRHVHEFVPTAHGTLMIDTLIWVAPLGVLGVLADKLFLDRHMTNFLRERNAKLKSEAERRHEYGDALLN